MTTLAMERAPLTQIVGTVAEVSPAPAPNRSGKIILDNGSELSAFPNNLSRVHVGETYEFGCEPKDWNGKTFYNVKTLRVTTPPSPAPANFVQTTPQRQAPATQQNGKKMDQQNYYKPTSPKDGERMFVCKILGDFIATGRINDDVETLTRAVNDLRTVWRATFGQDEISGD